MKKMSVFLACGLLGLSLSACGGGGSSSSSGGNDNGGITEPNQTTPLTGGGTVNYLTTPETVSPTKSISTEVAINGTPGTVYTVSYDIGLQTSSGKLKLQSSDNAPSVVTTPSPCVITGSGSCQVSIGSGNAYDGVYAITSKVTVNGVVVSNNEPLVLTVTGAGVNPQRYHLFAAMINQQIESITQQNGTKTYAYLDVPQQTISGGQQISYFISTSYYQSRDHYNTLYWSTNDGQTLESVNLGARLQQDYPALQVTGSDSNRYAVSNGIYFTAETTGYDHNTRNGYIFFYNPLTNQLTQIAEKVRTTIPYLTKNGNEFVAMAGMFYGHVVNSNDAYVSTYNNGQWTDLVTSNQFESYDFYGLSIINGQVTVSGLLEPGFHNSLAVFSYNNGAWNSWASWLPASDAVIVLSTVQAANGDIYIANLKNDNRKPCPSSHYGTGSIMRYHNGTWSTVTIPLFDGVGVDMMQLTASMDGGVYANVQYTAVCGGGADSFSTVAVN